jgi:hypothetical protein
MSSNLSRLIAACACIGLAFGPTAFAQAPAPAPAAASSAPAAAPMPREQLDSLLAPIRCTPTRCCRRF